MAYLNPTEAFERLKTSTVDAVKTHFPVEGKKNVLELEDVWIPDNKDVTDIKGQGEAKEKGRTWSVPIRAKIKLKDKVTGKVLDQKEVTIGTLPKMTPRFSYIVGGKEWQVNNQLRLKSGVFSRVKDNGELEAQWNFDRGNGLGSNRSLGFKMVYDPGNRKMAVQIGSSSVPLYPILKTLGVDDDQIERAWGKEILSSNMQGERGSDKDPETFKENAINKYYGMISGKKAPSTAEAKKAIMEQFNGTALRPDSTELTLGKAYKRANGEALLAGARRLLAIGRGKEDPDDRDSLIFKDLLSAEDLLSERLGVDAFKDVQKRIGNRLDSVTKIQEVVSPDTFGRPIKQFFTSSVIVDSPSQMNPIQFISGARRTTLGGEHGIGSEHRIKTPAQVINPSSFGFLDPLQTPESGRIGTVLQMGMGAKKEGKGLKMRAFNMKTGKTEFITPAQALKSNLAFPDQYTWKGGKPSAKSNDIKVTDPNGDFSLVDAKEVDYIIRSPKGMFDVAANMIPFLQNNQGNRTSVASRQLEQAVSLATREAPLVQVKGEGSDTFESALGKYNSHVSDVDGEVVKVTKDDVHIKGSDGKAYKIPLYNDFPLNDNKSVLSSKPLVKKGDQVKKGDLVADTNFTDKGTLAIGTNLRVAYMPYGGYNFEDGVVISESAAKKLTSEHMLRHGVRMEKGVQLNKRKFLAETAGQWSKEQQDMLDDDGVVRVGTRVSAGDPLIGALKEDQARPEQQMLAKFSKKLVKPVKPSPEVWEKDYPGVVTKVVKHGKDTTVYVKAEAPAQVGDKIVGRHGNKGIVTKIVPDHEMPRRESGEHIEVALNPTGIPTRINVGQVLETAAAKIARKTGKPYVVNNFDPDVKDYARKVREDLKKHGLSDTEDLIDPMRGTKGQPHPKKVLTGEQYILKLHHSAEKGISARSDGTYDVNNQPKKGPTGKAQTMDVGGLYSLLAHGATANIREMQTYKADMDDDFWGAIREGLTLPAPKVPFAYKKFEGMLKGMGVDVRKNGTRLQLAPLTDKQVLSMSNGELKRPDFAVVMSKNLKPERGSIFDPETTGTKATKDGFELGDKWTHITLPEKMPNPVFEKPVRVLTGLTEKEFNSVLAGKKELNGATGPEAISRALGQINVDQQISSLRGQLKSLKGPKLNEAVQKLKYLETLKRLEMTPEEAYTMKHVPVLPPTMRPISVLPTGDLSTDDVNDLYRGIGQVRDQMMRPHQKKLPDDVEGGMNDLRVNMYDGLKALALTGQSYWGSRHKKGILETISGTSPKEGYFQKRVIGKRQDLSMRGVIVPEPKLGVDEVGIPEKAAREIYEPFVRRRLVMQGYNPGQAKREVLKGSPVSLKALEREMEERPMLLKRDPVLHKYGVQAFKPVLVDGSAIKIHPLATSGYNADFDGDKMSGYVPVTTDAIQEARKMMPSNNLFSPSHGKLMYVPKQESMMGLFDLSKFKRRTSYRFKNVEEAARAVLDGKIEYTDVVKIDDPTITPRKASAALDDARSSKLLVKSAAAVETTVGRLILQSTLPEKMQDQAVLTDPKFELTKGNLSKVLSAVARKGGPSEFVRTVDKLKDLGNRQATGLSFGLDDIVAETEIRDKILASAREQEKSIRKRYKNPEERDDKLVELYGKAKAKILDHEKAKLDSKTGDESNRMYDWVKSGARGSWSQYHQMTIAPFQVNDSSGRTVPVPIDKAYSEGLDIGSYMASMHGARMGTIGRVKGTAKPGALNKRLMQVSMDTMITNDDCGTSKGISVSIEDKSALDRYLTDDVNLGVRGGKDKGVLKKGTLVTPAVVARLKSNKVGSINVRTPLKCSESHGICSTCFGLNQDGHLHQKGTNIGVLATHALGEPLTQMAMNAFHCNHADSIVFVLPGCGVRPIAVTMEDLFDMVEAPIEFNGEEEVKSLENLDWSIYDGPTEEGYQNWVKLTHVRRHAPDRPMRAVGDGGLITICQDNHPIAVWENPVECIECGHHRLKAPSRTNREKGVSKFSCAACGVRQPEQDKSPANPGFLSPQEIEEKRYYLQRDFVPATGGEDQINPIGIPGWIAGMFLAEGNVAFLRSHRNMQEKKPYRVYFSQKTGPVKTRLRDALFEAGFTPKSSKRGVTVHGLALGEQFDKWFGRYSHSKHLPPDFISYPRNWLLNCLSGVIDGDGTVERHKSGPTSVGVDTTSFALAQQLVFICGSLNLHASVTLTTNRELTRNQGYKVRIRLDGSTYSNLLVERTTKLQVLEDAPSTKSGCVKRAHRLVSLNREVMYTKKYVYDATTETGTLVVSGLRSHNTGGVTGAKGSRAQDDFQRALQLISFPKKLPGSAILAKESGEVTSIKEDKAAGGWNVEIGGSTHFIEARKGKPLVKPGTKVKKGDSISMGPKNPRELLTLTNLGKTQRYIADELSKLYEGQTALHRRNTEVVVRSLTNMSEVKDPEGRSFLLPGDRIRTSEVVAMNSKLKPGEKPIRYQPMLQSAEFLPMEIQTDWLARLQARDLKRTVMDAAAEGWSSEIHGVNPIPGMAVGAEFGKGTGSEPWKY